MDRSEMCRDEKLEPAAIKRQETRDRGKDPPPPPINSPEEVTLSAAQAPPFEVLKQRLIESQLPKMSKRKIRSQLQDPDILRKDTAILYQPSEMVIDKLGQIIKEAGTVKPGEEPNMFTDLPPKRAKHAIKQFQDNGVRRFNDPEFVKDAMEASERRKAGDFKAYEEAKFREWLVDTSDEEEEYAKEDQVMEDAPEKGESLKGGDSAAGTAMEGDSNGGGAMGDDANGGESKENY